MGLGLLAKKSLHARLTIGKTNVEKRHVWHHQQQANVDELQSLRDRTILHKAYFP
jgi:uncharacterized protein YrrD